MVVIYNYHCNQDKKQFHLPPVSPKCRFVVPPSPMISIQECPFPLFNSECEDICYHLLSWVLRWLLDFFQDFIFAFSGINGKESIAWSCPEPEFHWSVLNRGLLSIMAIMKCGEIKVNEKDLGLSLVKFLIKKTKQILIYHQRKAIFFFPECLITQS